MSDTLALWPPSPRVRSCPGIPCSRTREGYSAEAVAVRGAEREEDGEEDVAVAEVAEPSDDNAWEVDAAATRIQARHRGNAARRGDRGDGAGQPRRLRGAEFKLMQEADAARNIQVNTQACQTT